MIHTITFSLAGISISLHLPYAITVTEGFRSFVTENESDAVNVEILNTERLEHTALHPLFTNLVFSVYEDHEGYYRVFHKRDDHSVQYALGRVYSDSLERIWCLKNGLRYFSESQSAFTHIALEELLLRRNALILHASFVNTEYGGILFTGPSGVGKSTQAELWARYHGAEIINGDRTIIKKSEGIWEAYGSPYAGSSQYFVNKSCKIRAIISLQQAEKCKIQRMDTVTAFIKLYSGMIVNTWNIAYVEKTSELTGILAKEIPVYKFSCTSEKEAVDVLSNTLEKELHYEG